MSTLSKMLEFDCWEAVVPIWEEAERISVKLPADISV